MRFIVLVAVLTTAVAAQSDGNPFMIDTSIVIQPVQEQQSEPAVAFGSSNWLAVWRDLRSQDDLYASRVAVDGTVLDPGGIAVSLEGSGTDPDVAFDGTNWLVVWSDYRNEQGNIYAARVAPDGMVLDDTGLAVTADENWQSKPAVAFDGTNYLVVWYDNRNPGTDDDIYGARVTPAGQVLDRGGIAVSTAAEDQRDPDVAWNGSDFLVVWQDNNPNEYNADVRGARVSSAGTVLDPDGFDVSADSFFQRMPAASSDGSNWMVTWHDGRVEEEVDIRCARVSPGGAVLDPDGIRVAPDSAYQHEPAVDFNGTNFLVTWRDERGEFPNEDEIYGARVSPAGTVLDPGGIEIRSAINDESHPAVAFGGGNYLCIWEDNSHSGSHVNIYGTRVSTGGGVLDTPFPVSVGADLRDHPAVAWGETGSWLAVWTDFRDAGWGNIYGARVTTWDTIVDESGFAISTQNWGEGYPAVACGDSNWLVAWQDSRERPQRYDIYCARVTPGGAVLDPDGIAVCTADESQTYPQVAFDGTNWLVVWEDRRRGYNNYEVYGARVSQDGTVLDADGFNISNNPEDLGSPSVCFGGTDYLVAWEDEHGGTYDKVYGTRVATDGSVLDTPFNISGGAGPRQASIAHDGANWLVAWENGDIKCTRVAPDGTLPDSVPLVLSSGYAENGRPAAVYDGHNWLVAWDRADEGVRERADIVGARVTPEGVLLDTLRVLEYPGRQVRPALARNAGFEMLMVYQDQTGEYAGRTYNMPRVWGMFRPYPGIAGEAGGRVRVEPRVPGVVCGTLPLAGTTPALLVDAGGRVVARLKPGPNDVRHLAPGIYFVRLGGDRGAAKVVLQR